MNILLQVPYNHSFFSYYITLKIKILSNFVIKHKDIKNN
nr:MAG TPA: hypothetical protein [Bacteriophage sp.]